MTRPALTPVQRLVPVALAVMVGVVAFVWVSIGVAILGWVAGLAGVMLLMMLAAGGLALMSRIAQSRRRD